MYLHWPLHRAMCLLLPLMCTSCRLRGGGGGAGSKANMQALQLQQQQQQQQAAAASVAAEQDLQLFNMYVRESLHGPRI